jgi:hypothetical protein
MSDRCEYHLTTLVQQRNEHMLTCKQEPRHHIVVADHRSISNALIGLDVCDLHFDQLVESIRHKEVSRQ